jgi:hypothetical protein
MINTPHSSQVQDMVWNISYASFIPLDIMYHLGLSSLYSGRAKVKVKCGGVVDSC